MTESSDKQTNEFLHHLGSFTSRGGRVRVKETHEFLDRTYQKGTRGIVLDFPEHAQDENIFIHIEWHLKDEKKFGCYEIEEFHGKVELTKSTIIEKCKDKIEAFKHRSYTNHSQQEEQEFNLEDYIDELSKKTDHQVESQQIDLTRTTENER